MTSKNHSNELNKLIKELEYAEYNADFDRQHELCEQILSIDPSLVHFKQAVAANYYIYGHYEKCINEYEKLEHELNLDEDDLYLIASSYLHLDDEMTARAIMDDDTKMEELKFDYHYDLGDYENAIRIGDRLLEEDCTNEYVLGRMSDAYSHLGDEEHSLFYEYELSQIDPSFRPMLLLKLFLLERYEELIGIFESDDMEIYSSNLLHFEFNCILGVSYTFLNRHYDALKYLYKSNDLNETLATKYYIAVNYFCIRNYEKACKYFKKALEDNEDNIDILIRLSESLLYLGNYRESIELCNRVMRLSDEDNGILNVVGAYYIEHGQWQKGIEWIGSISFDYYDEKNCIYQIAENLSLIGENERAMKYYDALEEGMPDCPFTYIERAKHYKRHGEKELSIRDIERYNEMTGGHIYMDGHDDEEISFDNLDPEREYFHYKKEIIKK